MSHWLQALYQREQPSRVNGAAPPYDELLAAQGEERAHWSALLKSLESLGPEGLARRWQEGRRLIRDHGVTYNVYVEAQSMDRPWPLDPIPLVIDEREWASIEKAVVQRAMLLNAVLADCYGPRKLLYEQRLPPELLYANPEFLRPVCGVEPSRNVWLHFYAADLARSPDGQWWVIADRTQTPSGAGYALENRMVLSRTLPDVFGESRVRPLASFFQTFREALVELAPENRDNPRLVLLTPGPFNETYFEHAFLARHLGCSLVESGDLTVRDNRVYLKTLGGLLPVDIILRRQDDAFCDPLELRSDSMLGVPGLVQAVRSGNVAVANGLGSGIAGSPGLSPFLYGLCRRLFGDELRLPSVATWWCGQEKPLAYVREHLDQVVIKPAFRTRARESPVFGGRLSAAEKQSLLQRIAERPHNFVAQEQVALSTVPVWSEAGLESRRAVLRVYAAAHGGSYVVMPGGLTRISSAMDSMVVSVQRGGGSKDTWVLTGDDEYATYHPHNAPPRLARSPLDVNRATFDLPSRVADNLFWLGRYTERLESEVRLVRSALTRLFGGRNEPGAEAGLEMLLTVLTGFGYLKPAIPSPGPRVALSDPPEHLPLGPELETELLALVYDPDRRSGIGWTIEQVRRLAWLLRDRISADSWRVLNRLSEDFHLLTRPARAFEFSTALDRLDLTILTLSAFSGLVMESMTRGPGWRFLDIGRRIERASQIVQLLRYGLHGFDGEEPATLEALLEVADSSITYRSRYLTFMQADLAIDLLLVDEANPRSVAYQLARLLEHVDQLPGSLAPARSREDWRLVLASLTEVRLLDTDALFRLAPDGRRPEFERLLGRLMGTLHELSEVLTRNYLSHASALAQMIAP